MKLGTSSKMRRSRRQSGQQEYLYSNGIEADRISIVWPPFLLDRVMLLKVLIENDIMKLYPSSVLTIYSVQISVFKHLFFRLVNILIRVSW